MSTYLYLRCENHTPPLEAATESGQHLYDLDQIFRDLEERELIVKAWENDIIPQDHFRLSTASFLAQHQHCHITVVDEYGRTHTPEEVETE